MDSDYPEIIAPPAVPSPADGPQADGSPLALDPTEEDRLDWLENVQRPRKHMWLTDLFFYAMSLLVVSLMIIGCFLHRR